MKGKSKSKKKPASGETRVRLTLKDKREVIAQRKMGQSRETIQKKMGLMSDTLWHKIWRDRDIYEKADCSLKDFNTTHSKTDSAMRKMYESRVLKKIIDKSELLQLDYPAVRNIMIEVQENEEFLKEEDLQKLKLFTTV